MNVARLLSQLEQWMNAAASAARQWLPSEVDSAELAVVTTLAFITIAAMIYLTGRLLLGVGRNVAPDAVGSRRPLALGPLTETFAWMIPSTQASRERIRKDLMRAGFYHRRALEEYLGLRNTAVAAWVVFIGCAAVALANPRENYTPALAGGGMLVLVLIYAAPRVVLSGMSEARGRRIQYALPDALDMINMSVTGGLPLRKSIHRVGVEMRETHPDIACELAIIDRQTEAGSLDQALRQFAGRVDIADVTALATMVRHAERLGGNIATAFQEFADGVRRARRQQAEERGNKASIKLLFPVVFFLAPPIYILLLGPAAIELRNFIARESQPGGALSQSPAATLNEAANNDSGSASLGPSR